MKEVVGSIAVAAVLLGLAIQLSSLLHESQSVVNDVIDYGFDIMSHVKNGTAPGEWKRERVAVEIANLTNRFEGLLSGLNASASNCTLALLAGANTTAVPNGVLEPGNRTLDLCSMMLRILDNTTIPGGGERR